MILFVGDKPSRRMKPGASPFQGAVCQGRLLKWIELLGKYESKLEEIIQVKEDYDIINSYNFPIFETQLLIYKKYTKDLRVVALGQNASKRLAKLGVSHFMLPHPSGLNRQINDKEFIEKKLKECKDWLNSTDKIV